MLLLRLLCLLCLVLLMQLLPLFLLLLLPLLLLLLLLLLFLLLLLLFLLLLLLFLLLLLLFLLLLLLLFLLPLLFPMQAPRLLLPLCWLRRPGHCRPALTHRSRRRLAVLRHWAEGRASTPLSHRGRWPPAWAAFSQRPALPGGRERRQPTWRP